MVIYKNNVVKFSFEDNLVILGGIVFGDIWCVSRVLSTMRL